VLLWCNGNLLKDLNKKIADIQCNCLNLPGMVEFEDKINETV